MTPASAVADLIAGLSVAAVAVPQSLAYAQLAGMPAARGLYASAVPPIASAPFASSRYLQPGPTAVSALLTLGALSTLASPGTATYVELALLLALVVGVVRLLVGLLRAGVVAHLMSQPMLMGFVPAAAILILAAQLPVALGAEGGTGGTVRRAIWAVTHQDRWHTASIGLAAGAAALTLIAPRLHPLVPGALFALLLGLGVGHWTSYGGGEIGSVSRGFPPFSLQLPWRELPSLLIPGAVIAFVGFAEAASIARMYAARDRQRWDADRDFIAQGAANVAAAFSGGFPVGASFSRTALNRLAGARTPFSTFVTGAAVLAFLPAAGVLSPLPRAVLAAIVIAAVLTLVRVRPLLRLWRYSKPQFAVAWLTFALTLVLSPHVERAVLAGIGLSIGVHLWRELKLELETWLDGDELHLRPRGVLWFATATRLEEQFLQMLGSGVGARRLILHLDGLGRIDTTGALQLRELLELAREAGLSVDVVEVRPRWQNLVARLITREYDPLTSA